MLITNQRHEFVPPGGDSGSPIEVLGQQSYSPGQAQRSNVWTLLVPQQYKHQVGDRVEFDSYDAVTRALASVFCGDDIEAAKKLMVQTYPKSR